MPLSSTSKTSKKDLRIYERQAAICKAFGSPVRLRLLDLLGGGEMACSQLQAELDISKTNLSQHISVLKAAGVVSSRREGQQVFCSLTMPEVKEACRIIQEMLMRQVQNGSAILL